MADRLINSIYPIEYLTLDGVEDLSFESQYSWTSKQRYCTVDPNAPWQFMRRQDGGIPTTEYLVIDLGRVRQINYLTMDILQAPIDITVEYDTLSSGLGTHQWSRVTPKDEISFPDKVFYRAEQRNPYLHPEFYFHDLEGKIISTRYLRLGFTRREESWPTETTPPFVWPVIVKSLRVARQVGTAADLSGILLSSRVASTSTFHSLPLATVGRSLEFRQQFVVPPDHSRGDISPRLNGFSFLSETELVDFFGEGDVESNVWRWELHDITNPNKTVLLRKGETQSVPDHTLVWVDCQFQGVEVDLDNVYEMRVWSLTPNQSRKIVLQSPNSLPKRELPGSWAFTTNSSTVTVTGATNPEILETVSIGDFIQHGEGVDGIYQISNIVGTTVTLARPFAGTPSATVSYRAFPLLTYQGSSYTVDNTQTATVRVYADIVDSGIDILGNTYRYATRYDDATNVFDGTVAGWMSEPQPSPLAVESLFFDVRTREKGDTFESILDGLRIAPRTPGVRMQVYFCRSNLLGRPPETNEEWDKLFWEPINETYYLRGDQTIVFPQQIRCNYLKLEFSNLRPLPFEAPSRPALPPKTFKRYPTWIEAQFENTTVREAVNNWFVETQSRTEMDLLDLINDPLKEFETQYERLLFDLSRDRSTVSNEKLGSLVDVQENAYIDPITASKINFTANMYEDSLVSYVDRASVLGQMVLARTDNRVANKSVERPIGYPVDGVPQSSTVSNRIQSSFSHLAETPMWFNRACRHDYRVDIASFEGMAYFVGVDEIEFLRSDYTTEWDDLIITDSLANTDMLLDMTFAPDNTSGIEAGDEVWVTYYVDDIQYEEKVKIPAVGGVPLSAVGNPATNILVFSQQGKKGTQYYLIDDYDMQYRTSPTGQTVNLIGRSRVTSRWVVPRLVPLVYRDSEVVRFESTIYGDVDSSDMLVIGYYSVSGEEAHYDSEGNRIYTNAGVVTFSTFAADVESGTYDFLEFSFDDYDELESSYTDYDDLENS